MNIKYDIKSDLPGIFMALSMALVALPAAASAADTLFISDRIIRMELRSDFSAIQEERTGTPVYHDGELTYIQKAGTPVTMPVSDGHVIFFPIFRSRYTEIAFFPNK